MFVILLVLTWGLRYFLKKKNKIREHSEKRTYLTPDTHTYVYVSGGKKCSFWGKFSVLCFLETPVLRFSLLPYYRRIDLEIAGWGTCSKWFWRLRKTSFIACLLFWFFGSFDLYLYALIVELFFFNPLRFRIYKYIKTNVVE